MIWFLYLGKFTWIVDPNFCIVKLTPPAAYKLPFSGKTQEWQIAIAVLQHRTKSVNGSMSSIFE